MASPRQHQHSGPDRSDREPIAIIGIGCRFPGADSPDGLWRLLERGGDAITTIPSNRFDADAYCDTKPESPGKVISRQGGFLEHIDLFDAGFFGISPREAERIDPQQRLLLEVAWETFEDAGALPANLAGSRTGVFVGMWTNEFEDRMFDAVADIDLYATTGGGRYAAAGRLSYAFDLRGPSLTLDTACSSSLVAVHLACQSLRTGESAMALAGGVNLILQPHISIGYSRSRMLSPDGRCKFGDATANGYVRSEGVGLALLKPFFKAVADGDRIHALIRGSAVNNDGRASGLLVTPSPRGQEEMLIEAYRDAGVSPGRVHYMEAHGTGTPVGDPVELEALARVLSKDRQDGHPCQLGSIKANIGHTEAASGIAGLIRAVLILKNRLVPGNPHFREPNPKIAWSTIPMAMQSEIAPLDVPFGPAVAGVNSFGITGTNAHVVLEEAPISEISDQRGSKEAANDENVEQVASIEPDAIRPCLVPLSARSPQALESVVRSYQSWLASRQPPLNIRDLARGASLRRTHHDYRLAVVSQSTAGFQEQLNTFMLGRTAPGLATGKAGLDGKPRTVFVFPGQGSQWLGMGRILLEREPVFRDTLEQCENAFSRYVDWSLITELTTRDSSTSRLDRIDVIQPALLSIQVALAALWASWGVTPDALVGHSMGEIAAAHIAGILTLDDAARVICRRSLLLRRASGRGAMAMVELSLPMAEELIKGREDHLSIAVSNSPRSTVLSGDRVALDELIHELESSGTYCRSVKVDVASHSPQMDCLLPDLLNALQDVAPRSGTVPIYSTVTGKLANGGQFDAGYWADNLRKPVLFSAAVEALLNDGHDTFLELSPHPILSPALQQCFQNSNRHAIALSSMRRDEDDQVVMVEALGELYVRGGSPHWVRLYPSPGSYVDLPRYPWQRERFWPELREGGLRSRQRIPAALEQDGLPEIGKLFHEVAWREANPETRRRLADAVSQPAAGTWILCGDDRKSADRLASKLRLAGDTCVLAPSVETEGESVPDTRGNRTENLNEIISTALSNPSSQLRGIVFLATLNSSAAGQLTAGNLETAAETSLASVAHILQSLAGRELDHDSHVWLVTSGAQRVRDTDAAVSVVQTPLWGLGRVISNEHPEVGCRRVDLSSAIAEEELDALVEEMRSPSTEDEVAFRSRARYIARLRECSPVTRLSDWDWSAGSYLITGGLGALGLELSKWLVRKGVRHLVLIGRRGPSETAKAVLSEIRSKGVEVLEIAADVSRAGSVEQVFAEVDRSMPPVRAVFHAAGVLDDGMLLQLDAERFRKVMAPKVLGAWNLHEMSLTKPIDLFVMFSSATAVLGSPGQANYAAANAFLDGLAQYRKAQGLPALSIGWGPWSEIGLAATKQRGDRLALRGLSSVSPATGLRALAEVLFADQLSHIAVMPFDLQLWQQFYPKAAASPFFEDLRSVNTKDATGARETVRQTLLSVPVGKRRRSRFEAHLQEEVATVLRTAPARIDLDQPFKTLGLDSLLALELRNRLEAGLELTLPATVVWNHPTVAALTTELAQRMDVALEERMDPVPPGAADATNPTLDDHDELSRILTEIEGLSLDEVQETVSEKPNR